LFKRRTLLLLFHSLSHRETSVKFHILFDFKYYLAIGKSVVTQIERLLTALYCPTIKIIIHRSYIFFKGTGLAQAV
jgi:hypothetical protein